ncbi:MAG: hydrogenase expression/formation protein HypE, partial [Candidatus Heimdallarchaeota archaeon]
MKTEFVELAHGAGGKKMDELLELVMKNIAIRNVGDGIGLDEKDDWATVRIGDHRIVVSIDGHT